jgi:hypothetical protein
MLAACPLGAALELFAARRAPGLLSGRPELLAARPLAAWLKPLAATLAPRPLVAVPMLRLI